MEPIARGVLRRGSRILLCRNDKRGYYYLPGGHVDPGETFAAACAREFEEETGLIVRTMACGLVAEVSFGQGEDRHHEINLVFHVEHDGPPPGAEIASREPGISFHWVDLASLQDIDVRPRAIQAWLIAHETPPPGLVPCVLSEE